MISVDNLSICITDICNMKCAFCLRGDGRERKIDLALIPKIFEGIESINDLTITGGDPSLYPEAVNAIADYICSSDVAVHGMHIITNGKEYCQDLVDAIKRVMYHEFLSEFGERTKLHISHTHYSANDIHHWAEEYTYNFNIGVSVDDYHDCIPLENYFKYVMSGIYADFKETIYGEDGVIARGRAEGFRKARYSALRDLYLDKDEDGNVNIDEIYITVDGKIFSDCDLSYEMEDYMEPIGIVGEQTFVELMQAYVDENY